ncbi:uncharacterized protein EI97DRAFT_104263 [Westerdykella ornata]|uniref:Rieske domain-containing protein n=1 Tax=Westerdykella ornata TaxID=318751 RepID=A0A6A6JVL7_WESOR|nr:uncharacterized protein EI97DRAFT_104263 [Westerdykella ornata]KAF2279858.1 hypothetical protein EI97DRAFT_104263 [Westerdykella ornata]
MPPLWPWPSTTHTAPNKNDPNNPWLCAGPLSSFPNIIPAPGENQVQLCPLLEPGISNENEKSTPSDTDPTAPPQQTQPTCRVFSPSTTTTSPSSSSSPSSSPPSPTPPTLPSQTPDKATESSLLLFQYRSKLYATPYLCPHQSYPLTHASLSDIEDFGVILSAGITCPRHGWTWDLHTGEADRGRYRLPLYEVQVREEDEGQKTVWVRRKERKKMG